MIKQVILGSFFLSFFLAVLMFVYDPFSSQELVVRALIVGTKLIRIILLVVIVFVTFFITLIEVFVGPPIEIILGWFGITYVPISLQFQSLAIDLEEQLIGGVFGFIVTSAYDLGIDITLPIPNIVVSWDDWSLNFEDFALEFVDTLEYVVTSFIDDVFTRIFPHGHTRTQD
jgi:hypothetical protein